MRGDDQSVRNEIAEVLSGCIEYVRGTGLGNLPELFDGSSPQDPGGAITSSRNVGEVLRAHANCIDSTEMPLKMPNSTTVSQRNL